MARRTARSGCRRERAGSGAEGPQTTIYTVKPTNASIAAIRRMPGPDDRLVQEVSLIYQEIEWSWAEGAVTVSDERDKRGAAR